LILQKGAVLNHKVKDIGWKISNYKCQYGSFDDINNRVNEQSTNATFDNKINNHSSYSSIQNHNDQNFLLNLIY
jgi:hypothetical protein